MRAHGHHPGGKTRGQGIGPKSAGAREVYLIEEPMAAAIGSPTCPSRTPRRTWWWILAGAPRKWPSFRFPAWSIRKSVRVGGDKMDEAIMTHVKRKYNMLIGESTAEEIKVKIGSAHPHGAGSWRWRSKAATLSQAFPKTSPSPPRRVRKALSRTGRRHSAGRARGPGTNTA